MAAIQSFNIGLVFMEFMDSPYERFAVCSGAMVAVVAGRPL
jgi:hypothetical protein